MNGERRTVKMTSSVLAAVVEEISLERAVWASPNVDKQRWQVSSLHRVRGYADHRYQIARGVLKRLCAHRGTNEVLDDVAISRYF